MWCVVRSDASHQALQRGLDYACGNGADCAPIQSTGLCYLPNTIQNHAAYAYNSYYQRNNMAPGSCHFSGTATFAKTDPIGDKGFPDYSELYSGFRRHGCSGGWNSCLNMLS
ncbi:plasmodesmata callose-binding protein 3 [Capsicum chinense]|nr:plasmodesmata callose-binding protein 3 [Capsicum chinense]